MVDLHEALTAAAVEKTLPAVIAYNRIDGPGSTLDLKEFQQAFWSLPSTPDDLTTDKSMEWSRLLPRTIGITINAGTKIHAEPYDSELIACQSIEYGKETTAKSGEVLPIEENWLLKIMELFGLKGVKFVLHNLVPGIQSSGLGGSATATTGVCILANELAGRPFSPHQLVSIAARMEQDYGVSITGTQEQSNVLFGGITDYIWFPWGIPGKSNTGYGTSIQTELLPPESFGEVEKRMTIFHTGIARASTNVNSVWVDALSTQDGYELHKQKLGIAYNFREGLRLQEWSAVAHAIESYQKIRTQLCAGYMEGARELLGFARESDCVVFPLGAGGGGGVLVFAQEPQSLSNLRNDLAGVYREIPIKIQPYGHELINLPLQEGA